MFFSIMRNLLKAGVFFILSYGVKMNYRVIENEKIKLVRSPSYNYNFDKKTGYFERWGFNVNHDPEWGLPEICDMEITEVCKGVRDCKGKREPCKFCYKSNVPTSGQVMSLETFKKVFSKLPRSINQIAFGVDAQAKTNPDMFAIARHCKENSVNFVVPNITVADIDQKTARNLAQTMGAVAVSFYPQRDKNRCYNAVNTLKNSILKQKILVRRKKKKSD